MLRIILLILGILAFFDGCYSAGIPFLDVSEKDAYYNGVRDLYDFGMITDDGSHLFRPENPIERDMFVGLATSVSCQKCLSPTLEDILHYSLSPFIDLTKTNPNYYCIAYANETGIVQGYTLSAGGTTACEDTKIYSRTPFCEKNKTTRIEATAMLLRQGKLWDDTRNNQYIPKRVINDVNNYWQGYAEKGIQAGILTISPEGKVYPDVSISRGEFAQMASVMLSYNQCARSKSTENAVAGAIGVTDSGGKAIEKSIFQQGDGSILIPLVSNGNWNYSWRAIDQTTGIIKTFFSNTLEVADLGPGSWIIELSIIDPVTKSIVSQPRSTIVIENGGDSPKNGISIYSDTHAPLPGVPVHFDSLLEFPIPGETYSWDFGDGKSSSDPKNTEHVFEKPGIYTVTVHATDPSGNISSSNMMITIGKDGSSIPTNGVQIPFMANIYASPSTGNINTDFHYSSDVVGGSGKLNYSWDFGDGTISEGNDGISHRYTKPGLYTVELRVKDENGKESVSRMFTNVTKDINLANTGGTDTPISVIIKADPLIGSIGNMVNFQSFIAGGNGKNLTYSWNYGDGERSNNTGSTSHVYDTPGIYTVTLTIQDTAGNLSQSTIILSIDGVLDTDGDGIRDNEDACISIVGKSENLGCPVIQTLSLYGQVQGVFNGDKASSGNDRDNDGIDTALDYCPDVSGSIINNGCPGVSLLSGLSENTCVGNQLDTHGIIIASPICITCPCVNSINLMSLARTCDILSPAILSKDQKNIYSRGSFYQVQ